MRRKERIARELSHAPVIERDSNDIAAWSVSEGRCGSERKDGAAPVEQMSGSCEDDATVGDVGWALEHAWSCKGYIFPPVRR